MSAWKEYPLGEICSVQNGYSFKSGEFLPFAPGRLEVVKMGHIQPGGGLRKNPRRDYVKRDARLEKWVLDKGDIILAMTDMKDNVVILGVPALIDKDDQYVLNQRVARLKVLDSKKIDLVFLFNHLKWREFLLELRSKANSGVQVNLTTDAIKTSIIRAPSLPEQQTIAAVLLSLDNKIDLLHRQSNTLEALGDSLFRKWFIEEAEEGWKEISLSDISDHIKDGMNPSQQPEKIFKHYSLPAFDGGKEPISEIGKEILSNKYRVASNSILISKLNPRTPRVWALYGSREDGVCICSTEFQVLKPKITAHFGFIYYFLKSFQVTNELANASSGTSGSHQRINPDDILSLTLLFPPDGKIKEFDEVTRDYLRKIDESRKQIRTLTELRDALLPKFMSGEVRVEG